MLLLLIDTGVRVEEALTLKKSEVDLNSLVFKVLGRRGKERIVPFSLELRKVLYRFITSHKHELIFPTKQGAQLSYRNVLRDFKILGDKLGITGVRVSPHTLRHPFAYNYIKHGGNVLYLQRIPGHQHCDDKTLC